MSENGNNPNSYKKNTKQRVSVPVVFFGAFSAGVALMGSSAVSAQPSFQPTAQQAQGTLSSGPKLSLQPDGSVIPEAALSSKRQPTSHANARTKQEAQASVKQENNDWRVIVTEDGTLAVVRADEVPENATEVTCTTDGVCTPVVAVEAEETNTGNVTDDSETTADPSTAAETTNSETTNSETAGETTGSSETAGETAGSSETAGSNPTGSEANSNDSDSVGSDSTGPSDGFS